MIVKAKNVSKNKNDHQSSQPFDQSKQKKIND